MGNRAISYSLRGFEIFLKVPTIIIMRFGENNVRDNICQLWGWADAGVHGSPYISRFIVHKKYTRA